jgi:uncharacterized BrkB/YihY/UPF0761 family membrane protein
MTATTTATASYRPAAVRAMYVGLGLTLVALIFPFIDRSATQLLADHIQGGYPSYSPSQIDTAATVYLTILSVVGALGVACWLLMIWAARTSKRWTRWAAAAIFVAAVSVALSGLMITDTSGEVGLAPILGWFLTLPCIAGLVAVIQLWRK